MDKHPQITKALSNIVEQFYKGKQTKAVNTIKKIRLWQVSEK